MLVTLTVAAAMGMPSWLVTVPWTAAVVTPCAASGAAVTNATASGRNVGPLTLRLQQLLERRIVVERLEARIGMEGGDRLLPEFTGQPQSLLVRLGDQANGSGAGNPLRGGGGAAVGGGAPEEKAPPPA